MGVSYPPPVDWASSQHCDSVARVSILRASDSMACLWLSFGSHITSLLQYSIFPGSHKGPLMLKGREHELYLLMGNIKVLGQPVGWEIYCSLLWKIQATTPPRCPFSRVSSPILHLSQIYSLLDTPVGYSCIQCSCGTHITLNLSEPSFFFFKYAKWVAQRWW